jgi:flagellar basal body P-ring formation protein FlgA
MRHISWALVVIYCFAQAACAEQVIVAPRVIYPGQAIHENQIRAAFVRDDAGFSAGYAHDLNELAGKIAVRTILPGRPIGLAQVREPDAVEAGRRVRITFNHSGLRISIQALALSSGGIGETIQLRNPDSGKPITGLIRADGTVEVEPQ